jgi:glucosamine--fructose-6-phosphate aminotransferase (isomerizing)
MCGIFLSSSKDKDAQAQVLIGLKTLEYRGYDSYGIFSLLGNNKYDLQKFVGHVNEKKLKKVQADLAFGHTRWATHGGVTQANAHPHISNDKRFVLVHNGILENFATIKESLSKKGFKFASGTDTEVLVNLIQDESKGGEKFENILQRVSRKIKGENAFIVYDIETDQIGIYKNGSSLYLGLEGNNFYISSDTIALFPHTNYVYPMKEKQILVVDRNDLSNLRKLKFEKLDKKDFKKQNKNNFVWHTEKEIYDQKKTIQDVFANKKIQKLSSAFLKNKDFVFTGCGTAYNAAYLGYIFASLLGYKARVVAANEASILAKAFNKNTILFTYSQSGETIDTILLAKYVIACGGKVIGIINNKFSSLARLSTIVVDICSGIEVAVASTKAFTAQVAATMKVLGYRENFSNKKLNSFFENTLKDNRIIEKFVNLAKNDQSIFLLGKNKYLPVAMETSLKIKELSYIHTEAFAAGELKHGVLALIEKNVKVIVFVQDNENFQDIMSASQQVKARGGTLFGIGTVPKREGASKKIFDYFVETNGGTNTFFESVIVGQILAYKLALSKGLDPDKPRNLAKSVTVK